MKFSRVFFLFGAILSFHAAHADFQAGVAAIMRRDFATALKEFRPLAEQGNVAAQVNLGNIFMKGLGVEQNYRAAHRWYLKAAEQGERMAQSKLGILYYYGLGVDKDPAEAAHWFQKAAENGVGSAQTILGTLYASGEGVPKNPTLAYYWYTMAEEQGDKEASKGRESLEEEITPGQKDEAFRLMSETRKLRAEQDEKAFESLTAGLQTPQPAKSKTNDPPAREEDKTATKPAMGKKTP